MPTTRLSILNLGLGKIAASAISTIDPPRSPLEKHCDNGYPNWRNSELRKRRWVFSLAIVTLSQSGSPNPLLDRPYKFTLPDDVLRPIRDSRSTWQQRGRDIYAYETTLVLEAIRVPPEAEFDDSFIDVLAWRVAIECAGVATQAASTKVADIVAGYRLALQEANRANAVVIGTENIQTDDDHDTWIAGRLGYEIDG